MGLLSRGFGGRVITVRIKTRIIHGVFQHDCRQHDSQHDCHQLDRPHDCHHDCHQHDCQKLSSTRLSTRCQHAVNTTVNTLSTRCQHDCQHDCQHAVNTTVNTTVVNRRQGQCVAPLHPVSVLSRDTVSSDPQYSLVSRKRTLSLQWPRVLGEC